MNRDRYTETDLNTLRDYIALLYRTTEMTQDEIAAAVGCRVSAVNTAISLRIPLAERATLVSKRRRNARRRELAATVCPHCGGSLSKDAHPQGVCESYIQTQAPIVQASKDAQPHPVQLTLDLPENPQP